MHVIILYVTHLLLFCLVMANYHKSDSYTMLDESGFPKIEVVSGRNASLPCNIRSTPEEPVITFWYIDSQETPIYSYDTRSFVQNPTWADGKILGDRAVFLATSHPPSLFLKNVTLKDSRIFICRVDYEDSVSDFAKVQLIVIEPPFLIDITDDTLGHPLFEGRSEDAACRVYGGSPPPTVIWFQDGLVVDQSYTTRHGMTVNVLDPLASRRDNKSPFMCKGFNNNMVTPLLKNYSRNVTCAPLEVKIEMVSEMAEEGVATHLRCSVSGSNPAPRISWFMAGVKINEGIQMTTVSSDVSESSLNRMFSRVDHRAEIICRAMNILLPPSEAIEDLFILNVAYSPNVSISLGRNIDPDRLIEGADAFFNCEVDANPPPYKIRWMHKGTEVRQDKTTGVIVTDTFLNLRNLTRERSGYYQCWASNAQGDSASNNITISIKYAPTCVVEPSLRGVALDELANFTCEVSADPRDVTFIWSFNNSARAEASEVISRRKYNEVGLKSKLKYTPRSERDYGTLSCVATNSIGRQKIPCSFTVTSAGPPEEVSGCLVTNVTSHSAAIRCLSGFDGGLPQQFLLKVWDINTGQLIVNVSKATPSFKMYSLDSGQTYQAGVTSYNSRGSRLPNKFLFLTLKEAEMHKSLPSMVEPSPLMWFSGVVGGIFLVSLLLVGGVCFIRNRRLRNQMNTTALTHIVLKDNNPDLISVDATEINAALAYDEVLNDSISVNISSEGNVNSTDNLLHSSREATLASTKLSETVQKPPPDSVRFQSLPNRGHSQDGKNYGIGYQCYATILPPEKIGSSSEARC